MGESFWLDRESKIYVVTLPYYRTPKSEKRKRIARRKKEIENRRRVRRHQIEKIQEGRRK